MWKITFFCETLWVLAIPTLTYALTSNETLLFDSSEIQVIRQSNLVGRVSVDTNQDGTHTLTSNGIPDNALGVFPNKIKSYPILEQNFSVSFPQHPILNEQSQQCLRASSIIGFAVNGVAIFSPFDEDGNDLNEVDFDGDCQGRTAAGGIYYFAQVPDRCSTFRRLESDQIFGVAIDGFPIYGPGEGANKITNADLDACHGKMVNGQYRYYMTDEWPYVLGCFRGTPMSVSNGSQVLTPSNVCKFACNKNAQSSEVLCSDDFLATTKPVIGLTEKEISIFTTEDKSGERLRYLVNITSDAETITFKSKVPYHVTGNYSINGETFFEHNFEVLFPKNPKLLTKPKCLPSSGIIGFASNGVPLFSHFDNDGSDIKINGTFDSCYGQINNDGVYHYHDYTHISLCVSEDTTELEFYGVAMDGFPIYTTGDSNITNSDLDVCHGRLESNNQYRYYVTNEFPYIFGCFRGTPQELKINGSLTNNSDDCLYACNVNGTTPEADRAFCDSTEQNFIFYIIVGVTGFVAFVFLVLILVCIVRCLRQNKCCCWGEKENDVQYHL